MASRIIDVSSSRFIISPPLYGLAGTFSGIHLGSLFSVGKFGVTMRQETGKQKIDLVSITRSPEEKRRGFSQRDPSFFFLSGTKPSQRQKECFRKSSNRKVMERSSSLDKKEQGHMKHPTDP
ncbi:hypothetical protein MPNT_50181 [Candidatus Methylacidithermus pantelleriae]|uniref:Uncharacterized protein n=1 Tax=Candidatus Methylacidithermus pantelleriae TaxID=2744239 RepID=A0A8J2BKL4_9BACT|nr:hypothetical protein MPNT_50181 [Candidatus Methylacidithermus pantelleriae]